MYLSSMGNKRLILVLLSVFAVVTIAGCSSASPTQTSSPTPTPTVPSRITLEEAGAFMRAIAVKECASANLDGASFTPTWEPATRSWLVHVTASGGLSGDYRIFEERGFAVDPVNPLIPGEC